MNPDYLEFEQPIVELEAKIDELRLVESDNEFNLNDEIAKLQTKSKSLIESIFSLDGLGLLTYESIIDRDYPVVFAGTFIFGLMGLVVQLLSDITYTLVDPRIDFESREV